MDVAIMNTSSRNIVLHAPRCDAMGFRPHATRLVDATRLDRLRGHKHIEAYFRRRDLIACGGATPEDVVIEHAGPFAVKLAVTAIGFDVKRAPWSERHTLVSANERVVYGAENV